MVLIVAQILGIMAVGIYLLSYQLKKRIHIVWATCSANALYVLQYILLGAFSGALIDVISTAISFCAAKKNTPSFKKNAKWIIALNIFAIAAAGISIAIIKGDPLELIPVGGAFFQSIGLWFENEQTIRKCGLIGAPFWLVYNFMSKAYGAAFGTVLFMVSVVISLIRYRKQKEN